jgi:hypothetical protein
VQKAKLFANCNVKKNKGYSNFIIRLDELRVVISHIPKQIEKDNRLNYFGALPGGCNILVMQL